MALESVAAHSIAAISRQAKWTAVTTSLQFSQALHVNDAIIMAHHNRDPLRVGPIGMPFAEQLLGDTPGPQDLDGWSAAEDAHPTLFGAMYQLWIARAGKSRGAD